MKKKFSIDFIEKPEVFSENEMLNIIGGYADDSCGCRCGFFIGSHCGCKQPKGSSGVSYQIDTTK